jgi:D-glycero-D-manno-heptose 1,7-bisphosphate phosphatase
MKNVRQCVILMGGLGTRLGDLTTNTAKPLLNVGDRPFLAWIMRELSRFGFEEIVLLAGYRAERIEEMVRDISALLPRPINVRISVEREPSGTGGAVWHAQEFLDERFLLINGDSWLDFNLAQFLSQATQEGASPCHVLLHKVADATRYGTVTTNGGLVVTFKPKNGDSGPGLINAGMYVMSRAILGLLRPNCSLENEVLPVLAASGDLMGHPFDGFFIDIGIPSDYRRAQTELPRHLIRPAVFLDRDGVLNQDLGWVGSKERFHWRENAISTVRMINDAGAHALVVTNQAGVAKGYYSEQDVQSLHHWMEDILLEQGATIDDWRSCPHHPDATLEKYRRTCNHRKPEPGMILDLARRWSVNMNSSFMIGDKDSDAEAARRADIPCYLITTGTDLMSVARDGIREHFLTCDRDARENGT